MKFEIDLTDELLDRIAAAVAEKLGVDLTFNADRQPSGATLAQIRAAAEKLGHEVGRVAETGEYVLIKISTTDEATTMVTPSGLITVPAPAIPRGADANAFRFEYDNAALRDQLGIELL